MLSLWRLKLISVILMLALLSYYPANVVHAIDSNKISKLELLLWGEKVYEGSSSQVQAIIELKSGQRMEVTKDAVFFSSNSNVAAINKKMDIHAVSAGISDISVSYQGFKSTQKMTVMSSTIIEEKQIEISMNWERKINSITLNWTPIPNIQQYKVYRKSREKDEFKLLAENFTASTYLDKKVASKTTYFYLIKYVDESAAEKSLNALKVDGLKTTQIKKLTGNNLQYILKQVKSLSTADNSASYAELGKLMELILNAQNNAQKLLIQDKSPQSGLSSTLETPQISQTSQSSETTQTPQETEPSGFQTEDVKQEDVKQEGDSTYTGLVTPENTPVDLKNQLHKCFVGKTTFLTQQDVKNCDNEPIF